MNIKDAAKTVNQELKKLKSEVSDWHVKREEVFGEVKTSWQSEYNKTLTALKDNPVSKDVIDGLKAFEKFNNKIIQVNTKKLFAINNDYSVKIKDQAKVFGVLADPYLKTVKNPSFGVGVKTQNIIEQDLIEWIAEECSRQFNSDKHTNDLDKKLSVLTKDFNKSIGNEEELLKYMAKMELLVSTLLDSMAEPLKMSKTTRQSIEQNTLLAPMLYELEAGIYIQKIDQGLNDFKSLKDSVHMDSLVDSYGTSPDEDSLKRAKLAIKGVKESFGYFKKYFEENVLEDLGDVKGNMNSMYLNDIKYHLNLAKSCLVNDVLAMEKYYDMDTASRDMMSDSLHEYLNSDEFFDQVKEQKKPKKKMKV